MQVVWFKRDLRIADHMPLVEALKHGALLPLYIFEPELWKQPDLSYRHYQFLKACLADLEQALQNIGQRLIIKVGDAVDILEQLNERHTIQMLWSHQETWNGWTYSRDKNIQQWTKKHQIPWNQHLQHGVIRCLNDRDGWARRWYGQMNKPVLASPKRLHAVDEVSDCLPAEEKLGLHHDSAIILQKAGRVEALKLLHSFLNERGEGYTKEMSSPVTAFESCSRLSVHIAFGTLSIREVFHAVEQRIQEIKKMSSGSKGKWSSALRSYSGRLRWHCHFIQKLEDEPSIEFENVHHLYNGLREGEFDEAYFEAWKAGKTGYPMVDACMRALTATGWLNFRMRAMLMSFASYHLWLHWREPALHLARLFTDYEPGIHYSQVQMQSGTTGINSIRIYNPIKQGVDHDPDGLFIRKWLPELVAIPQQIIHTPWMAPSKMNGYPAPIVVEQNARKAAADKLYRLRKNSGHEAIARKIVIKHASRKSAPSKTAKKKANNKQLELPL